MGILFLLFVAIPVAEIALFIWVGDRIGLVATLAAIVITALVGSALVSRQGAGAMRQVQEAFFQARFPAKELAHGLMIAIAGTLLITPGFLTDGIGFLLLIPPVREVVRRFFSRRFGRNWVVGPGPRVTDAQWTEPEPPNAGPPEALS